jgi:hypothetical protein
MNNSIDFDSPRTREQFAAIAPEVHRRPSLMFKVLLLVQWSAVFGMVFMYTQATTFGVQSLLPLLGFATIMLASLMTFSQLVTFRTYQGAANETVWKLCSLNTETKQTNERLEEIIEIQTGELVDITRQLKNETRQRIELQNECESMLRQWMEAGQPFALAPSSADQPVAGRVNRRALGGTKRSINSSSVNRHEPKTSESLLRPSRRSSAVVKSV